MTIIVWKDGILAADSASWMGPIMVSDQVDKVKRIGAALIGCCGDQEDILAFYRWYEGGAEPESFPKMKDKHFGAIVATAERVVQIDGKGRTDIIDDIPFGNAVGYGDMFVRGALANGATAIEAVELAIAKVAYVGGHVTWAKLEDVEKPKPEPGEPTAVEPFAFVSPMTGEVISSIPRWQKDMAPKASA